jgi:chromosome segregation and condensation protein ScpB
LLLVGYRVASREPISALRGAGFISFGPRSPTPGAPYNYVTTKQFLSAFGMETLRDLPNIEALKDAGLLSCVLMERADSDYASDGDDSL